MSKHRTHTDGVEERRLPWTFGGQCRWYVVYWSKCCEQWKSKGEERDICDVFRYVLTRKVIGRETGEGKRSSVETRSLKQISWTWPDKASDVGSGMPEDTFEPCKDAVSLIQKLDITEWHIHNHNFGPGTFSWCCLLDRSVMMWNDEKKLLFLGQRSRLK